MILLFFFSVSSPSPLPYFPSHSRLFPYLSDPFPSAHLPVSSFSSCFYSHFLSLPPPILFSFHYFPHLSLRSLPFHFRSITFFPSSYCLSFMTYIEGVVERRGRKISLFSLLYILLDVPFSFLVSLFFNHITFYFFVSVGNKEIKR